MKKNVIQSFLLSLFTGVGNRGKLERVRAVSSGINRTVFYDAPSIEHEKPIPPRHAAAFAVSVGEGSGGGEKPNSGKKNPPRSGKKNPEEQLVVSSPSSTAGEQETPGAFGAENKENSFLSEYEEKKKKLEDTLGNDEKEHKKTGRYIWIVFGILVLLAGAFFGYVKWRSSKSSSPPTEAVQRDSLQATVPPKKTTVTLDTPAGRTVAQPTGSGKKQSEPEESDKPEPKITETETVSSPSELKRLNKAYQFLWIGTAIFALGVCAVFYHRKSTTPRGKTWRTYGLPILVIGGIIAIWSGFSYHLLKKVTIERTIVESLTEIEKATIRSAYIDSMERVFKIRSLQPSDRDSASRRILEDAIALAEYWKERALALPGSIPEIEPPVVPQERQPVAVDTVVREEKVVTAPPPATKKKRTAGTQKKTPHVSSSEAAYTLDEAVQKLSGKKTNNRSSRRR